MEKCNSATKFPYISCCYLLDVLALDIFATKITLVETRLRLYILLCSCYAHKHQYTAGKLNLCLHFQHYMMKAKNIVIPLGIALCSLCHD
jgi:hypothetical protein